MKGEGRRGEILTGYSDFRTVGTVEINVFELRTNIGIVRPVLYDSCIGGGGRIGSDQVDGESRFGFVYVAKAITS
jgi:hypothetical protein